ncbi:MAG: Nucleoside phosphorylase-like protein [Daejeonella sp.]|nr:Nucleoside phosphorylase-like protein [Daejeonella sp.]
MVDCRYIEVDVSDIKHLLNPTVIMLVTATDLETSITHQKIKPIDDYNAILQVFEGNHTYYFGVLGNYLVAHVQCAMGSISRDSSIMTVSTALNFLNSKTVIMIGIAFGVDSVKQGIGDVLISESIIPYNIKRVGEEATIQRGLEAQASQIILNRLKNIRTWEHLLPDNIIAKKIFTRLLSGEELIDNLERRTTLSEAFPDCKGGEMEGAGVYAACGNKIDWVIVKGICDFADGQKHINKEQNQQIAIEAALSLCLELLTSNTAFKQLGISPHFKEFEIETVTVANINEVLFDFYDPSKEQFYIKRELDSKFSQIVKASGLWIFGPSGCGKSNLIVRNLYNSKTNFVQVNLAPCIGCNIDGFFDEILYELSSRIEGVHSQIQPRNFSDCTRALVNLLLKYYRDTDLVIFIEEIPISSNDDYKNFVEKIISLIISINLNNGLQQIRFVLSSINDPQIHISLIQQKIFQYFGFLQLSFWDDAFLTSLITIIENEFNFQLNDDFKLSIIKKAQGSPRFIKKFFRSIYTIGKTDEATLKFALVETERELSKLKNV